METPLEKYFGIPLSWCCRTDPIDFGNDPSKVKELILADCKVERIIDKIGKEKERRSLLEFLNLIIHQIHSLFCECRKTESDLEQTP